MYDRPFLLTYGIALEFLMFTSGVLCDEVHELADLDPPPIILEIEVAQLILGVFSTVGKE